MDFCAKYHSEAEEYYMYVVQNREQRTASKTDWSSLGFPLFSRKAFCTWFWKITRFLDQLSLCIFHPLQHWLCGMPFQLNFTREMARWLLIEVEHISSESLTPKRLTCFIHKDSFRLRCIHCKLDQMHTLVNVRHEATMLRDLRSNYIPPKAGIPNNCFCHISRITNATV